MNCRICGKELLEKQSRGFCDECFSEILKNKQQLKEKILDNIGLPVVVIDSNVNVFSANNDLLKFIDKSLTEIAGQLGGDVFNCTYAKLPGGCGKTEFCEDCEIRDLVVKTLEEKQSKKENIHLTLDIKGKEIKTKMNVSTRIIEGKVFLQINDVDFIG